MRRAQIGILAIALLIALPAAVAAQDPDGAKDAKIHVGQLSLTPTVALSNIGVDTNVFNEADQLHPKKDFTFTVTPAFDAWYRIGQVWLIGTAKEDLVYYQKFSSERAANLHTTGGVLVPFNRLVLKSIWSYANVRDRPGYEINARSQRIESGPAASAEYRLGGKTFVGVRGVRNTIDFDKSAVFLGQSLQDELNRTETTVAATGRHALTPLTSLTFDFARQEDRFLYSTIRDSNSTRITGGVRFDPFAIIKGSAVIGVRKFTPLSAAVIGYTGPTAAVDLSYVAKETTKIGVQVNRDLQYSFELSQPYYVQAGLGFTLDQRVAGPWDVTGKFNAQRLSYQNNVITDLFAPERVDHVRIYGGGVLYRMGRDMKAAFTIERQSRKSPVELLEYSGLRYGGAVTYGF